MHMSDRIGGLRRAVTYGQGAGKTNMIVDLDVLAALLDQRDALLVACRATLDRHNYQGTGEPWSHLFDLVRAAVVQVEETS